MLGAISRLYPTIFSVIFLGAWALNAFALRSGALGLALLACWILGAGALMGRRLASREHPALGFSAGVWTLLSLSMLAGAAIYQAWAFPPEAAYAIVLLSVPLALWAGRSRAETDAAHDVRREHAPRAGRAALLAAGLALFFLALLVRAFALGATEEPVRSLWLVVSPSSLLAAFAAFILLFALLLRGRERAISLPLTGAALLAFLSAAALVFPLGAGFDPFIHRATVDHLLVNGTIDPKPPYYAGQYALELLLAHGFALPARLVDVWLLPALAALLLPGAFYAAASSLARDRRLAAAALMGAFLLPLSSFAVTTPQGLANLWTLLLALFAVPLLCGHGRRLRFPLALGALAACAVHPVAGIPAFVFLALAFAHGARAGKRPRLARAAFWAVAALGSVAIPAAFALNAAQGGAGGLDLSAFSARSALSALRLNLFVQNGYEPLLDFAELWARNGLFAVLALSAFGAWKARHGRVLAPFVAMAVVLGINYLLLSTVVDFSFLIDYERGNYAARLLPLVAFFLAPALLAAISAALARVRASSVPVRAGTLLFFAALATAALYGAYPRHDAFVTGHGINVGRADVDAAYEIERDAAGAPYVVLANQSVSAAAIRNFGFEGRYWGEAFHYPVPTGGALYRIFLAMSEAPSKETAFTALDAVAQACEAAACQRELPRAVYFAVNDYWWQSDRIVERSKGSADAWFAVGGGAVTVFRYDLPTR